MKQNINKLLLDWIGEDDSLKDGTLLPKMYHYNQALTDIREKVPELVERVQREFQNDVKEYQSKFFEEFDFLLDNTEISDFDLIVAKTKLEISFEYFINQLTQE
jgi:hypothetical protein